MEQEIQGILKSFNKEIFKRIFVKINFQYCPDFFWIVEDTFGLFYLVLAYSSLLRLVMGCYTFFKKVKAHKARQKLGTLKKVKVWKAHKKSRHVKRWGHVRRVENEGT